MPALVVLGSLAWVLVIHGETTLAMATIWWRSETFAHGFVIVPIVLDKGRLCQQSGVPYRSHRSVVDCSRHASGPKLLETAVRG